VGALKPNVYIIFHNITETDWYTKIYYNCYVYKGASIPLNLDRYVGIFVTNFYSRNQNIVFNKQISSWKKISGIYVDGYTLINAPGNNDTIESIIKFRVLKPFKNIFSCWTQANLIYYGKLYVTKMEVMKNSNILEDIPKEIVIYSFIDAYFVICNSKDHDFE